MSMAIFARARSHLKVGRYVGDRRNLLNPNLHLDANLSAGYFVLIVFVQNRLQNVRVVGAMLVALGRRAYDTIRVDDRPKAAMIVDLPIVEAREASKVTRVAAIKRLPKKRRACNSELSFFGRLRSLCNKQGALIGFVLCARVVVFGSQLAPFVSPSLAFARHRVIGEPMRHDLSTVEQRGARAINVRSALALHAPFARARMPARESVCVYASCTRPRMLNRERRRQRRRQWRQRRRQVAECMCALTSRRQHRCTRRPPKV